VILFRRGLFGLAALFFFAAALGFTEDPPDPQRLLTSGHAEAAIPLLESRVAANANSSGDWHLLSRAYLSIQKFDQAIGAGEKATALSQQTSDYHLWLARAYGEKADHISLFNLIGAYRLARRVKAEFERAVALDQNNLAAQCDLAEYYFTAPSVAGGDAAKAQRIADKIAPSSAATARWIQAHIAEKKKNYPEAEKQYRAAIEVATDKSPYWLNLAHFFEKRTQLDDMQRAIGEAAAQKSFEGQALYDAAEMLVRTGRNFPAASEWLRRYIGPGAHTENAPLVAAHYLLGSVLEKQGDRAAAAAEYRASLALVPDYDPAQEALQRVASR